MSVIRLLVPSRTMTACCVYSLPAAYDALVAASGTRAAFIVGDFNADCSYVSSSDWASISLWTDPRFTWLLAGVERTNLAVTPCAYDRLVVALITLITLIILKTLIRWPATC
jgi:deoxyribonuclease-1